MRISGILIFLTFYLSGYVYSQKLTVTDKKTGEGIENVSIYNQELKKSVQTDSEGAADISTFSKIDTLNFQHPSYYYRTATYNDVLQSDFNIALEEKIIKIDEVIISASKWEQNSEYIPNTVTNINSENIEFSNPPTSADMLDQTGQVFMQKSQLGGGSPMIRGFSANRLLIVVDGVRLNNAIYRSGNLQNVISIDVNAIEEAEVLFGPGSVMYGSEALGGVMDFHIKSPVLNANNNIRFEGNALMRYATAAKEKTTHIDFSLSGKKFAAFTSFSFTDFDDLITGNKRTSKFPDYGKRTEFVERINGMDSIIENDNVNRQRFSGYNQFNVIQKFKLRTSNYFDLDYGFYYTTSSDIPRYDRLILYDSDSLPENSEWNYGPQKWMMNRISANTYKSNKMYSEARFILSYQNINESRIDRKFRDDIRRTREDKVHILNFNADFDKTINKNHQLYYGVDCSYNKVISEAHGENIETHELTSISTRYPDGGSDYGFFAAYTNYLWIINQQHSISTGIRFTHTWLEARLEDKSDIGFDFDEFTSNNGALNGSLGWVYRVNTNIKIDLIGSSGFRTPNIDDMGKLFDSEPGHVIVPNKDLKPEYAYNLEMGITKKFGKNLELHLVGFHTWVIDAMVRRDFSFNGMDSLVYDGKLRKVQALTNTGKAHIYGFSFSFKGDVTTHLGVSSSLNYTNGRDITENVPLRHTAPLFGRTALYFRQNRLLCEFNLAYSGKKAYENLSPSEKDKIYLYTADGALAWYTLNFLTSHEVRGTFIFNLGIENILNKHYRTYSSGISAPGRNFIFGMRIKL